MDNLIDGNHLAAQILEELKEEIATLGACPKVTFIRVGEDPASISYIRKKQKTATQIGIESHILELPEDITQQELLRHIDQLNNDQQTHGILVQSPLPPHIDELTVFNTIAPHKDVDGFNSINLGKLAQDNNPHFSACTPSGIVEMLKRMQINIQGKKVVILGRSLIVGRPLELLLSSKEVNATVTLCHSKTQNLAQEIKQADIFIAAAGKPKFITADMIKPGAVVIDVGINRIVDCDAKNGCRIVGDVDFNSVQPIASWITPVPGGVGPMTVAMLMKNTLKAYKCKDR